MARLPTIAQLAPGADNASKPRLDADPRRALVRLVAELMVEDYIAELSMSGVKKEQREE